LHGSSCLQLQLDVSRSLPPCSGPSRTSKIVKTSTKYCTIVQYLAPLRNISACSSPPSLCPKSPVKAPCQRAAAALDPQAIKIGQGTKASCNYDSTACCGYERRFESGQRGLQHPGTVVTLNKDSLLQRFKVLALLRTASIANSVANRSKLCNVVLHSILCACLCLMMQPSVITDDRQESKGIGEVHAG
jgi:hypothetical protein